MGLGLGGPLQPRPHLSLGIYLSTGTAGPQSIACQGPRAALTDHPRTLPSNSSVANRPLTPSLWAHLFPPCSLRGWEALQKLHLCRR